ncbi:hypothetical protein L332_03545 [Agrococcus pavilionensis RW1]|uniref:Uncharacterized protein n=1 Tax=Agrococcus pavilionensis RW1 TaxID=1330458 RepID=U1L967_9MICO|nr:hypothetical protein [Agrococcus pavilionensis]ERG63528.1 hypothetical protein L332_03545 [Agrococcus pavilionensis RW1]
MTTDTLATVTPIPTAAMLAHRTLIVCDMTAGIECDVCDRPGPVAHAVGGDTLAEARELAAIDGWLSNAATDRDICPPCIARGHTTEGDTR